MSETHCLKYKGRKIYINKEDTQPETKTEYMAVLPTSPDRKFLVASVLQLFVIRSLLKFIWVCWKSSQDMNFISVEIFKDKVAELDKR